MKTKTTIIAALTTLLFGIFLPFSTALAATYATLQAYGVDTVAGYSTVLKTSQTYSRQNVTFLVQKPDGTKLQLPAVTNNNGIATVDLSDYHTRKAGQYFVSAQLADATNSSAISFFTVHPGKVSAEKSTVTTSKTIAQPNGQDGVYLDVTLQDDYSNVIQGHQVQLISSRAQDRIVSDPATALTNQYGVVNFQVSSSKAGTSVYSVLDLTANVILAARPQIAFITGSQFLSDVGGDFSPFIDVAQAASGGSIHHFEIGGLPSSIQANQNVSFTVTAQDENNQTIQNYMGKIHFSADGSNSSNVTLPEDYTFKAEDLGTHNFSLGLSFKGNGNYTVVATDLENMLIKGEKAVTVGSSGSNGSGNQNSNASSPTIDSPVAGTYSQKTQIISGKAPAGLSVKVFDNEKELGTVQVAADGTYKYQTADLDEGVHKIYVVTLDAQETVQNTSPTVEFSIDTTAPKVEQIDLNPNDNIKSGQAIEVKIVSEENLSEAAVVFNGDIVNLAPSLADPATYSGSIQAPDALGVYPVDVLLVDQLGNEGSFKAKAQVTVKEGGASTSEETTPTETLPATTNEQPANQPPSKVNNVIAYASDKKVTLTWEAASDDGLIQHYRVYYGFDPANLVQFVDTKDASTTWYVPNLDNGKQYYFALTAFDANAQESTLKSDLANAIPFASEISANVGNVVLHPAAAADTLGSYYNYYYQNSGPTSEIPGHSGPEMFWVLGGSGLIGGIVRKLKRKIKQ